MTPFARNIVPAAAILAVLGGSHAPARAADALSVGANAPAFRVPDQNGKTHTLAQDKGKIVLLAFYPADFTGGCTVEAHSLSAAYKDLTALGVKVYGVSVQDSKSHQSFCTKEGIPYTLLADTDKQMSESFGVLSDNGAVAKRVTYIIGKDGRVRYVDRDVNSHLATAGNDYLALLRGDPGVTGIVEVVNGQPKYRGMAGGIARVPLSERRNNPAPDGGGAGGNKSVVVTGRFDQAEQHSLDGVKGPIHEDGTPTDDGPASIQNFKSTAADVSASTRPVQASLGKPAPSFTLTDVVTGKQDSLDSLRQGKKATVLMFVSTRCPISNGYTERIQSLVKKYGAEGVSFVGLNANGNESVAECKQHATENKFAFPILKDAGNKVADAYDARVTPECYVVDAAGNLVYHGRIDNDVDPSFVKTHDLAAALDDVVAGRAVGKATAKAFGCSIKRAN